MINNNKEMSRSIIVLSVIALISGLLLSMVFQLTKITEDEEMARITKNLNIIHFAENGYEKIETNDNNNENNFFKAVGEDYFIVIGTGQGYGGTLEMYVSFCGNEIINLKAGTNSDTPGMRENALNNEYYSTFYVDIYNAVFEFSDEGFDSAVGATFTSNGVLAAVKDAVTLYKSYIESNNLAMILNADSVTGDR